MTHFFQWMPFIEGSARPKSRIACRMKNGASSYFDSSMHALFEAQVHDELSVVLQPGRLF